ncbi:MAG: M12 family metallo-peptidase [Planctomycetota bacterium]
MNAFGHEERFPSARSSRRTPGLSMALAATVLLGPCAAQGAPEGELVRPRDDVRDPRAGSADIARSRAVDFDLDRLRDAAPGTELRVRPFADTSFDVILQRRDALAGDRAVWHGTLGGLPDSHVLISTVGGGVAASFYPNDGRAPIYLQTAPGMIVARQFAADAGQCGVAGAAQPALPAGGISTARRTAAGCTASGDVVSILQVYTPAAETQAGGTTQIDAQAQLLLAELNLAVTNSGIQNLQFVRAGLHRTDDGFLCSGSSLSNWQNTLFALQSPTDGVMDEVHAVRSSTGADLVALLVADDPTCQGGTGGYAGVLTSASGSAESIAAFSVSNYLYNYVFPHEVGHNLGCSHDCGTGCGTGLYSYSNGYKWAGSQPGTSVMGYQDVSRPYYPIFSTPLMQRGGVAVGSAATADATRTIEATRQVIANYRGGCVEPFGTGCAGDIGAMDSTSPGDTYRVLGQSPAGVGSLFIGASKATWNGLPLPLDLGLVGATGCTIEASPDAALWTGSMPTSGSWIVIPVSIPSNPALVGARLYHQWHFYTGGPLATYQTSRGLQVEIDA